MFKNIDDKTINSIRYLSNCAITNAKSGHSGMALGAAPIFYALYKDEFKFSAMRPQYFNRDRLAICAGHVSTLYYTILHAFGYDVSIEDLKNVRKLGSKTKGHPRYNPSLGIDATSGPLGQGVPNGVGMAIAESMLAERFNKPDIKLVDHYTYVLASDGGLMEGISNEASSLAGTLKLSKLIVLYDSNNISMETPTSVSFTEDVLGRYRALGWNTIEVKEGNDSQKISEAISQAKAQNQKPTIIKINTVIGHGSPLANTVQAHGSALTEEQLEITRQNLGVTDKAFELPNDVKNNLINIIKKKDAKIDAEEKNIKLYMKKYPQEYQEFTRWVDDYYSKNTDWSKIDIDFVSEASRKTSSKIINKLADQIPNLITGAADVAPSVGTTINNGGSYSAENRVGRNIHFGVREHAMAAICNGIALHGGIRVICSTFMVFSDYMRHAIRLCAQMNLPILYVLTHDSIVVGQDGATHQPIEYNVMYRATPNINFLRPADARETLFSYKVAIQSQKPTILSLSRQNLKLSTNSGSGVEKGAYIVSDDKNPQLILIGMGSELSICEEAANELRGKGIALRVVSMPSVNLFEEQTSAYKEKVLPENNRKRIVVEAGATLGGYKYSGLDGVVIGIDEFGQTGNGDELYRLYGFTPKNIVKHALKLLKNK